MALIEVYNTTNNPVVYGDGQVLGGLERMKVEESLVSDALKSGALRIARSKQAFAPAPTPVPVVDSAKPETDVPLNAEKPSGDAEKKSPVDEGSSAPTPATIRKTRRPRKSSVKE